LIVVDASAMVRALVFDGQPGASARAELAKDELWAAPEHWKIEVYSSVRGLVLGGKVAADRARRAVDALGYMSIMPVSINDLLERMWELHASVSPYDAAYVAAAELHGVGLLTADARLARATGPRCAIRLV
jgi:predicted nucleic acid-binding protein